MMEICIERGKCCDENTSIYLAWFNKLGAIDYYLFCERQRYSLDVETKGIFENYVDNLSEYNKNRSVLKKESFERITLGADDLKKEDILEAQSNYKLFASEILRDLRF